VGRNGRQSLTAFRLVRSIQVRNRKTGPKKSRSSLGALGELGRCTQLHAKAQRPKVDLVAIRERRWSKEATAIQVRTVE
jgi:hypothetical protein